MPKLRKVVPALKKRVAIDQQVPDPQFETIGASFRVAVLGDKDTVDESKVHDRETPGAVQPPNSRTLKVIRLPGASSSARPEADVFGSRTTARSRQLSAVARPRAQELTNSTDATAGVARKCPTMASAAASWWGVG